MRAETNLGKVSLYVQRKSSPLEGKTPKGSEMQNKGAVTKNNQGEMTIFYEHNQSNEKGFSIPTKNGTEMLRFLREEMDRVKQEGKKNKFDDHIKAMRIAHNIMMGKKVPPQDEQFLIEYNSKLYQAAKTMGSLKKQKEEVESVLEDDRESNRKMLRELDGEGNDSVNESIGREDEETEEAST